MSAVSHVASESKLRMWLLRWLYAVAIMHVLVGVVLTWFSHASVFDSYYQEIETAFWGALAPTSGRAELAWWVAIFGATLQGFSLLMWVLVRLGDRSRDARIWLALAVVIAVWAPQDLWVSWRGGVWSHIAVDVLALLVLLPPLLWLRKHDGRSVEVDS